MRDVTPIPEICDYVAADGVLGSLLRGGVWDGVAPQGTETPFAVLTYVPGGEDEHCGGAVAVSEHHYFAQVVGEADEIATIRLAGVRLHRLLTRIPAGALAGYNTTLSQRVKALSFMDAEDATNGVRFEHRGGHYRVKVEEV